MEEKMKRIKLLLSTLLMMLLVTVMSFSVVACKKNGGNGGQNGETGKNPGDLGITDSSDDNLSLQSIALSGTHKKEFAYGAPFTSEGLVVTATYIDFSISTAYTVTETLTSEQYVIDSSEYNPTKVGTHTIYVSYTRSGVTVTNSYDVTVLPNEIGYGGIVAELKEGTETKFRLTAENPSVTIDPTDVVAYKVNDDGTLTDALAQDEYTAELYLGSEKIENNVATKDGVYTLVVTLKSNTQHKDFVNYFIANAVKEIAFEDGTLEQPRSNKDTISSTWSFKVTYENGVEKTITSAAKGFSGSFDPLASGEKNVNITYTETDAFDQKHEVDTQITINILPNTETLVLEYEYDSEGSVKQNAPLVEGDDTVMFNNTSPAADNTTESRTFSDGKTFTGRIQLNNGARHLILNLKGVAKITAYFRASSGTVELQLRKGSSTGEIVATASNGTNDLSPAVYIAPEEGTYVLIGSNTVNLYALYITTLIPVEGQSIDSFTVSYHENYGTTETVVTDKVLSYEGFNTAAGYTPVRPGYTFDGWFTAAEGGEEVTFPLTVTEDTAVYAHWSENEVEAIKATKTKTEYVLTNSSLTINDWNDIAVTDANDGVIPASWSYAYKLFSDEACTTEVTSVSVIGTYYIQVDASKGEKHLYAKIPVTVVNPTAMTVTPATVNKSVAAGESFTLAIADLNLLFKSNSGDEMLADAWTFDYVLKGSDGETVEGTSSWTLAAGTYTLTVTATKGADVELTATVTITITEESGDEPVIKTESFIVEQPASQEEFSKTEYAAGSAIVDNSLFTLGATVKMETSFGKAWGGIQDSKNQVTFKDMNGTDVNPNVGIKLSDADIAAGEKTANIVTVTAKEKITLYLYAVWANDSFNSNKAGTLYYTIDSGEEVSKAIAKRTEVWTIKVTLENGSVLTLGAGATGADAGRLWLFGAEAESIVSGGGQQTDTSPVAIDFNALVAGNYYGVTDGENNENMGDIGTLTAPAGSFVQAVSIIHTTKDKLTIKGVNETISDGDNSYTLSKSFSTQGASTTARRAIQLKLDESYSYTVKVWAKTTADDRHVQYINGTGSTFTKCETAVGNGSVTLHTFSATGGTLLIGGDNNIDIYLIVIELAA